MLKYLILGPIVGGIALIGLPWKKGGKELGLFISLLVELGGLILLIAFREDKTGYQFVEEIIDGIKIGIDGVGLIFVLMTVVLIPISILSVWEEKEERVYIGLILIMEGVVIGVFTVMDIIGFYIGYEGVIIPMYLIILIYGSRERKVKAGNYILMYTIVGGIGMLIGLLMIYSEIGTTEYEIIRIKGISESRQYIIFWLLFIGFAIKVPMIPFHIWLPEAHVEAPTGGSVILAAILLKLGTYGIVRYIIPLMNTGLEYNKGIIYVICMVGIIYGSMTAIRQGDMKRIIAYASIAHMNMTIIGVISGTEEGYKGGILQMISHGIVSGGLFLCVGVLYDRYHSRSVKYYSGIVHIMPVFSLIWMIITFGNIGLPGTSSFVGEFMILAGIYKVNVIVGIVAAIGMILGAIYSLWLYNRIIFGNIKEYLVYSYDLSRREFSILLPILLLIMGIGLYPSVFIDIL